MARYLSAAFGLTLACSALSGCAWPQTELYHGLSDAMRVRSNSSNPDERAKNVLLRSRVQTRFPVNSDERDLLAWLADQKVKITRRPREDGGIRGIAARRLGTWPCDRSVRVFWEASPTGRIEAIGADEGDTGCL